MDLLNKINEIFFAESKQGNILRKIVIMGMIGILLLLIGSLFSNTGSMGDQHKNKEITESPSVNTNKNDNYSLKLADDLEKLLSMIDGVGMVRVKLYISRGEKYEYEYNQENTNKITTETDQNGGQREIQEETVDKDLVIVEDMNGNEKPVVQVEKMPEIKGVLIVAEGAERSEIKYKISKAVSNFMDLPLYKINVLPGRGGN